MRDTSTTSHLFFLSIRIMMMWNDRLHFLFLTVLFVIFVRCSKRSKRIGKRLRLLRHSCARIPNEALVEDDITMIVKRKRDGAYIRDTDRPAHKRELERYLNNKHIPAQEINFRHVPDIEEMPRMFAFYKEETDDYACVACMAP